MAITKVDELAAEIINAKEQLRNINTTIWRDRKIIVELEKSIEEKKGEEKEALKRIEELKEDIASYEVSKGKVEKEYGAMRDNLKAEISKLSENKKKDEEKYQISIEELSNDVKVLSNRKSELNRDIANLEDEKRKAVIAKEQGIADRDRAIKEVQEKLGGFNLLFEQQDAEYRKVNREIEDMNKRLEEKGELDAECQKLEGDIEKRNHEMDELREEINHAEDELGMIKREIADAEKERAAVKEEIEGYVKIKLDLKDRKDKLDAKEKYLRKRFEEAGIKFD